MHGLAPLRVIMPPVHTCRPGQQWRMANQAQTGRPFTKRPANVQLWKWAWHLPKILENILCCPSISKSPNLRKGKSPSYFPSFEMYHLVRWSARTNRIKDWFIYVVLWSLIMFNSLLLACWINEYFKNVVFVALNLYWSLYFSYWC